MSVAKRSLSLQDDRYQIFKLAKEWMAVFMRSDEAKTLSQSEIVRRIIDDVVSHRITEDEVEKAKKSKVVVVEKIEEKAEAKAEEKKGE